MTTYVSLHISPIANIANSQDPQKLIDTANQIAQLLTNESIPLDKIPDHIKRQQDELQRIKKEIEKWGAVLKQKSTDIQTIDEYKKLEEELHKYGLSMKFGHKIVSVILAINQIGYDPLKIIKELARIKSLRQTERKLKNDYKVLESRASKYKEIIPICEQITRLGIRFPELFALHGAVIKKADLENLPMQRAGYRIMEEIENYERIGGLKMKYPSSSRTSMLSTKRAHKE